MNYRHHFHAGNFADVMKHVLLVQLVRALQRKEQGILFLDTHAGRGSYDLTSAARGDTLVRRPEWPDGIGRLWSRSELAGPLEDYLTLVRQFDHDRGNRDALPRFYPGSPWFVRLVARAQDRLALCELQGAEYAALAEEMRFAPRTSVHEIDGYVAVRAMLPPLERRALVLIDPPYELPEEFSLIAAALKEGLARLAGGVFAVWYPLTGRAQVDTLLADLRQLSPRAVLQIEMTVTGESSSLKMRGCGLMVVNPPWQFDRVAEPVAKTLAEVLTQEPGARGRIEWCVPAK